MKEEIPKKLYRYIPLDLKKVMAIYNNRLYFSDPKHFNDPYDFFKTEEVRILLDAVKLRRDVSSDFKEKRLTESPELSSIVKMPSEDFKKTGLEDVAKSIESSYSDLKVLCFSEDCDNLLLWAHYADSHKGMCVEFNTEKVLEARHLSFCRVIYRENPEIACDPLISLFLTKSTHWEYEKEWRLLPPIGTQAILFEDAEIINAIYFGVKADLMEIRFIISILNHRYPHILFYQARKDEKNFSINFDAIDPKDQKYLSR
jgi:hypothetical protein